MKLKSLKKNKGFTLVELIIVVAIIAILASVLAPQYLQYVERTRESNDLQIATNLVKAAVMVVSDPKNNVPAGSEFVIRWDTSTSSRGPNPSGGTGGITAEFRPYTVTKTEWLLDIEDQMRAIMGVAEGEISIGESKSALSKEDDLLFRIDVSTGSVDVHEYYDDIWVEGIGLDVGVATF